MSDSLAFFVLFGACAVFGAGATRFAVWLSHRLAILDNPGGRKAHREPVAYLGGLGFTVTVLFGVLLYAWMRPHDMLMDQQTGYVFVGGLVAIFFVGLWDDVAGMRPLYKLGFQIAVATALWAAGLRVERIAFGLGAPVALVGENGASFIDFFFGGLPSLAITVGWFVALMNAINLIDGLDGLAGGVALIASLSLGIVGLLTWYNGLNLGLALPAVAAGACLGFLVFNWHPAKIFLGDSGSLSIGYTLAGCSLMASTKAPALLALLVPVVALGLPLFETTFSFARRALTGTNPFKADRRHLHHRLLDAGLDQRRVVLVFLYATVYFGVNAVLLAREGSALVLINVALIGVGLVMLIEYLRFFEKRRESLDAASAESRNTEKA